MSLDGEFLSIYNAILRITMVLDQSQDECCLPLYSASMTIYVGITSQSRASRWSGTMTFGMPLWLPESDVEGSLELQFASFSSPRSGGLCWHNRRGQAER